MGVVVAPPPLPRRPPRAAARRALIHCHRLPYHFNRQRHTCGARAWLAAANPDRPEAGLDRLRKVGLAQDGVVLCRQQSEVVSQVVCVNERIRIARSSYR